ncbi:unnamed protein product [Agarophyton chilense]
METKTLTAAGDSSVTVYHFGAHVTSWKNAAGREMLYTSPTAILNGTKAIRGGIPICFPQFGKKGPLRQHGFARNSFWTHDESFSPSDGSPSLRFTLSDTEETRNSDWGHAFEVAVVISLSPDGNSLFLKMEVTNNNLYAPFSFTTALHSYFCCESQDTVLTGYSGLTYEDNLESGKTNVQDGDIHFGKEVDRVYLGTKDELSMPTANLIIIKQNMPDAVVWNPYVEKTTALSDMPDDDWRKFICIEPGRIADPAIVAAKETWTGAVTFRSIA